MIEDYYTLEKVVLYLQVEDIGRLVSTNRALSDFCSQDELWLNLCQRDNAQLIAKNSSLANFSLANEMWQNLSYKDYGEIQLEGNAKKLYRLLLGTNNYVFLQHSNDGGPLRPIIIKYCRTLGEACRKLQKFYPMVFTGYMMFDTEYVSLELKKNGVLVKVDGLERRKYLREYLKGDGEEEVLISYDTFYSELDIIKWGILKAPGDMFDTKKVYSNWHFIFQYVEIKPTDNYLVAKTELIDDRDVKFRSSNDLRCQFDNELYISVSKPKQRYVFDPFSITFHYLDELETLENSPKKMK